MFDINIALNLFRSTCEEIVKNCENAETSEDVQDAFEDYCEVEGMMKLLTRSCKMDLPALNEKCCKAYNNAWKEWCRANNRINYDPVTGKPRRV